VTYVNLEGRDPAAAQKVLEEGLIPIIKSLPGFRTARFVRALDGKSGVGTVIFDTEANAKAGLHALTKNRPDEAPPVTSTAIFEVVAEV
jgi:hypothetical protein